MYGPFIWYKNFGSSFFRFITIHMFNRCTDRQTDISPMANTTLHTMQCGKSGGVDTFVVKE